jgi:hypothetical protein
VLVHAQSAKAVAVVNGQPPSLNSVVMTHGTWENMSSVPIRLIT